MITPLNIAPLAAERPATTRTPLDAWLDSESRMSALILPLARKPAAQTPPLLINHRAAAAHANSKKKVYH